MTIREILVEGGIEFTRSDMAHIGLAVSKLAKKKGLVVSKVWKEEHGIKIQVTEYPEDFRKDIEMEIMKYYSGRM